MRLALRKSLLACFAALVVTSVLLMPATASAADKDCANFRSQRAAQFFFLRHGGPQEDPDRRSSDHRYAQLREPCADAGPASYNIGRSTHAARSYFCLMERNFTPDEANELLPTVRPLVERMVEAKRALDAAQAEADDVSTRISGNGGGLPPARLAEVDAGVNRRATELAGALEEIQALGVVVKDLDTGLVDFPSVRDGRDVLLCWRLGEDEVAFWHGYDDGFAGRRPI